MQKPFLTFLFYSGLSFFCFWGNLFSQELSNSPYSVNWAMDAPLLFAGSGISGAGFYLTGKTQPLTLQEINQLDARDVPLFDRAALNRWSPPIHLTSDVLLYGSMASPLTLLVEKRVRNDWFVLGVMGAETFLWTYGVTSLTKSGLERTRPFVYNPDAPLDRKLQKDARFSFISGHSSFSAAGAFFFAKVWNDYHPGNKWAPAVWGAAIAIPAATAGLRIAGGKHFPSDVVMGYAAGAAIGLAVPALHKKKKENLSFYPISGQYQGMGMCWRF